MKTTQVLLPAATGILGLLLGVALAPILHHPANETVSGSPTSSSKNTASAATTDEPDTNLRTRAREREVDKRPKEPGITIPLSNLSSILRSDNFDSGFLRLGSSAETLLVQLGATRQETEEISELIEDSKSEILAMEKKHLKPGRVTAEEIHIDSDGMRRPAQEIVGRIKDGIRSILPADLAECLIAVVNWDQYYPTDEKIRFEITRNQAGELTAFEIIGQDANVIEISADGPYKDDGTPIPADRVFTERWRPLLKGLTILPKNSE